MIIPYIVKNAQKRDFSDGIIPIFLCIISKETEKSLEFIIEEKACNLLEIFFGLVYTIVVGKSGGKIHCFSLKFIKNPKTVKKPLTATIWGNVLDTTEISPEEGEKSEQGLFMRDSCFGEGE